MRACVRSCKPHLSCVPCRPGSIINWRFCFIPSSCFRKPHGFLFCPSSNPDSFSIYTHTRQATKQATNRRNRSNTTKKQRVTSPIIHTYSSLPPNPSPPLFSFISPMEDPFAMEYQSSPPPALPEDVICKVRFMCGVALSFYPCVCVCVCASL